MGSVICQLPNPASWFPPLFYNQVLLIAKIQLKVKKSKETHPRTSSLFATVPGLSGTIHKNSFLDDDEEDILRWFNGSGEKLEIGIWFLELLERELE